MPSHQFLFNFSAKPESGRVAFTTGPNSATSPLLLVVCDAGRRAVHLIEPSGWPSCVHHGYLPGLEPFEDPAGEQPRPRGVATCDDFIAISMWTKASGPGASGLGPAEVRLFEAQGSRCLVHTIRDTEAPYPFGIGHPYGLCFSHEGKTLVVPSGSNDVSFISLFTTGVFHRGSPVSRPVFVCPLPSSTSPCDAVEYTAVDGKSLGWFVCSSSFGITFVTQAGEKRKVREGQVSEFPVALGFVSQVGLFVRHFHGCDQLLLIPEPVLDHFDPC